MIATLVYIACRYRTHRKAAAPAALGHTSSLDFYRSELARQLELSKDGWAYLLPFAPGLALIVLGRALGDRSPGQTVEMVVAGVALFVGIAWLNARKARQLERVIDALDAL